MDFDYDAFVNDLKSRKAVPLVVLYGVPDNTGVNLDWLSTSAYDNGNDQLKTDANDAMSAIARQINS